MLMALLRSNRLVDTCVSSLVDTESTSTATIKMQVHFGRIYQSYGDVVLEHRDKLNASLRELDQDIIDSTFEFL